MADPVKLVGNEPITWNAAWTGVNYFVLFRVHAISAGIATIIKFETDLSGTAEIKLAVYSDLLGEPGALLGNTSALAVSGWNEVDISPINISSGLYYWLSFACGGTAPRIRTRSVAGKSRRYKSITYSGFSFPDPAGSGFTPSEVAGAMELWGTLASGGAGRLIGSGDPSMIHVAHPKMIHVANPSLIRARGG